MNRSEERIAPLVDGPPQYDKRQITPGQFVDMQLGYLSNLGAEVELVVAGVGRVIPATIVAVGRSYFFGETPNNSRLLTQEEIDASPDYVNCHYVTFCTTSETEGQTTYAYERLSYRDLALAPIEDSSGTPIGWDREPIWYLRWPGEVIE